MHPASKLAYSIVQNQAISTNQKPTIYRNLYENTGPGEYSEYTYVLLLTLCFIVNVLLRKYTIKHTVPWKLFYTGLNFKIFDYASVLRKITYRVFYYIEMNQMSFPNKLV